MMRALIPAKLETSWILLDAEMIREVLGAEAWLPIPGARAEMPGVIAWRGRALPVLDLAAPFGLERLRPGQSRPRILIAEVADNVVALPVDAAREVHAFKPDQLGPPNITAFPYTLAEAELFGRVLALVDLPKFVLEILGGSAPELMSEGGAQRNAAFG